MVRKSLRVSEKSILRDRTLRNHFEHFDEKLEESLVKPGLHIDGLFLAIKDTKKMIDDGTMITRVFDPQKMSIIFYGDTLNLAKVYKATKNLRKRAD